MKTAFSDVFEVCQTTEIGRISIAQVTYEITYVPDGGAYTTVCLHLQPHRGCTCCLGRLHV